MKKTLFITAVLIFFSLAPHVFAQGFVPLAPIEGLTKGVTANTEGLAIFFNNLYKFAIGMAAVLAVIMIIWGGIEYSWQDIPGAKSNGKERIQQAILGLVLVLSPVLVFSIINPSILNLSINLKPLDTKSGGGTTAPTGPYVPTRNTGRQITGSSNVMNETFTSCTSNSDCDSKKTTCMTGSNVRNANDAQVVCLKSDGTVNSRIDSSFNPFSSYACAARETLSVKCTTFSYQ